MAIIVCLFVDNMIDDSLFWEESFPLVVSIDRLLGSYFGEENISTWFSCFISRWDFGGGLVGGLPDPASISPRSMRTMAR